MLTAKQFGTLKKGNVGVNAEKSEKRIPETFKSASTEQKNEIVKLSGLSKYGFYKASTSPRVILSLSCVLGISPFYLTGESDDKGCTDDIIKEFYKKCISGTQKKANKEKAEKVKEKSMKTAKDEKAEQKPVPKKAVKKNTAVKAAAKPVEKKTAASPVDIKKEKNVTPPAGVKAPKIDDESLVSLLRALSIRAKFGGEAKKTYNAVVELLIK